MAPVVLPPQQSLVELVTVWTLVEQVVVELVVVELVVVDLMAVELVAVRMELMTGWVVVEGRWLVERSSLLSQTDQ